MQVSEIALRFLLPSLALQLAWYALLRPCFPTRKQRAWIPTLFISFFFGLVVGPLYIVRFFSALAGPHPAAAVARLLQAESALDLAAAASMVAFLPLDLALGAAEYAEHIQMDSGYIHHAVYLPIYAYMLCNGLTPYLLLGACCEIPTFIMALGTLVPALRQDLAFGVTFFFTRIVWFIVLLLVYMHPVTNDNRLSVYLYLPPTCAALLLHLFWFSKWLKCGVSKKKAASAQPVAASGKAE